MTDKEKSFAAAGTSWRFCLTLEYFRAIKALDLIQILSGLRCLWMEKRFYKLDPWNYWRQNEMKQSLLAQRKFNITAVCSVCLVRCVLCSEDGSLFGQLTCRTEILSCRCAHRWAAFCWWFSPRLVLWTCTSSSRCPSCGESQLTENSTLKWKLWRGECVTIPVLKFDSYLEPKYPLNLVAVTTTNADSWVSISSRTAVECVLSFEDTATWRASWPQSCLFMWLQTQQNTFGGRLSCFCFYLIYLLVDFTSTHMHVTLPHLKKKGTQLKFAWRFLPMANLHFWPSVIAH